jgi:hypothetical protein
MKRGLIAAFVLGGCLGAAMAPAGAGRPVRGCPTDAWELRPTGDIPTGSPSADGNGDGLSCVRQAPEGSGLFAVVDNRSDNGTGH